MELSSSDKERIQHQYDALAKKTWSAKRKPPPHSCETRSTRSYFFGLSESELAQLSQRTITKAIISVFKCPALMYSSKMNCLPKPLTLCPKGNATLSFCPTSWIWSDAEIGELLNVVRTTVFRTGNPRLRKSNSIWREKQMMNTVRKSENLLPFPVISAAANGDHNRHVRDLEALRGLHSETLYPHAERRRGQYLFLCGRGMRNRLQVRLITRTLAFHVG